MMYIESDVMPSLGPMIDYSKMASTMMNYNTVPTMCITAHDFNYYLYQSSPHYKGINEYQSLPLIPTESVASLHLTQDSLSFIVYIVVEEYGQILSVPQVPSYVPAGCANL